MLLLVMILNQIIVINKVHLKDFIQDFNGLSDKTVCNSMNITVDSLVQTYDSPPKYVGFQLDRLIYYHDLKSNLL